MKNEFIFWDKINIDNKICVFVDLLYKEKVS